ncbi:MAG: EMC3/TMCO1 family protein [archaeon]
MFLNPAMDLVLISALFAVISQTLQTVLTNRKEVRKSQKKMQETNKRYKELMKQGGKADPQEVEKIQKEMMEITTASMKSMPKLMIANMIVFIPLFAFVHQTYDGTRLPFFPPFSWVWAEVDWFWYYVLCSLLISLFVNHVMNWHHEKKEKEHTQTIITTPTKE